MHKNNKTHMMLGSDTIPRNKNAKSPVIIVGMHRSGTSMISRLLEALGLFVGSKKEHNNEAWFFLGIDQWLLWQCGANWENPAPIHYLVNNHELRTAATQYITRYLLRSPRSLSYLGWKNYVQFRSPLDLSIPWGWKCPLSTFTLPLWLDIFPSAKIIHIYRHGVDTAESLRTRARKKARPTLSRRLYYQMRFLHWLRPNQNGFSDGMRCTSLEGGFSLWEEYFAEARLHVESLGARAMEVKYEDFLQAPLPILRELAGFCELEVADQSFAEVARLIRPERAFAYRHNPELSAYADHVADKLSVHSY